MPGRCLTSKNLQCHQGFWKKCLVQQFSAAGVGPGEKRGLPTISGLEPGLDAFLKLMQKFNIKGT